MITPLSDTWSEGWRDRRVCLVSQISEAVPESHSVGGMCPQEWGKGGPRCSAWSLQCWIRIRLRFSALQWHLMHYSGSFLHQNVLSHMCCSDWETKYERRKMWGNEGHQASSFLNASTLFFSEHMLSEAEEAIGSTFTAPWSSVYVSSARISVWCVLKLCQELHSLCLGL